MGAAPTLSPCWDFNFYRLVKEHGSAEGAIDALPQIAKASGVENYEPHSQQAAQHELTQARKLGIKAIPYGNPSYTALLARIPDPPPILWVKGDLTPLTRPIVAVVGARNAAAIGTRFTKRLVQELGESGILISSGLARGIDTAAHAAALPSGSIAVMAGGVDYIYPAQNTKIYPAQNTKLAQDMLATGLRLSEQPIGLVPQARHFPTRNRIISGLAHATIVIEATAKSGSLITAHAALDQGRDVFAVRGHPFDERAAGCNNLIRDGAQLLRNTQDIINMLEHSQLTAPAAPRPRYRSNWPFGKRRSGRYAMHRACIKSFYRAQIRRPCAKMC